MRDNKYKKIEAMLYNYTDTLSAIKNLERNIAYYTHTTPDIKAINYEPKVQTSNRACLSDEIIKNKELLEGLHKRLESRKLHVEQVDNFLACLNDEETRLIKYKYFDKLTEYQVADKLNISISAMRKRKRKIIERSLNVII